MYKKARDDEIILDFHFPSLSAHSVIRINTKKGFSKNINEARCEGMTKRSSN
jgi:hypothetical protein